MTSLELAVRFGKTLIIQEMDGVEPVLYPLLRKDLIAQGNNTLTINSVAFLQGLVDELFGTKLLYLQMGLLWTVQSSSLLSAAIARFR